MEERLKFYETGAAPRKNIDVMEEVARHLKAGDDAEVEAEESAKKKKKKKDKKTPSKKRKAEDDAADEEEDAKVRISMTLYIIQSLYQAHPFSQAAKKSAKKSKKAKKPQKSEEEESPAAEEKVCWPGLSCNHWLFTY